jgi:hypothetical protein
MDYLAELHRVLVYGTWFVVACNVVSSYAVFFKYWKLLDNDARELKDVGRCL